MVPLIAAGRSIGALVVDSRQERHFAEHEVRFLQLMANQAAIAIERARLLQEEIQRQRLAEELDVAREIQLSLLPMAPPAVPGWQIVAVYQAAHQVGGDFYDFFEVPLTRAGEPTPMAKIEAGDWLGMIIADVADKGVPAALFMAVGRTLIRTTAMSGRTPAAALARSNELIFKDTQTDLFLSVFYAAIETRSGRMRFADGGHNRPLWWRAGQGKLEELAADGIVLGVLEEIHLEEREEFIEPGDFLVFFTDGVTEAMDLAHNEFGAERLRAAATANPTATAHDILWNIVDAVNTFTRHAPQSDDFTLFVVKRL
jgi:sigma-B regulation protein RsbU (phosphoserine phosphatase)